MLPIRSTGETFHLNLNADPSFEREFIDFDSLDESGIDNQPINYEDLYHELQEQIARLQTLVRAHKRSFNESDDDEDEDEDEDDENSNGEEGGGNEEDEDEYEDEYENEDENEDEEEENEEEVRVNDSNNSEIDSSQNMSFDLSRDEEGQGKDPLLYDKSQVTLKESCFYILEWKKNHNITYSACNELLTLLHYVLLPKNNHLPTTFATLTKKMEIPEPTYLHVCVNDCQIFPSLPQHEWKLHFDEKCGKCGQDRFKVNPANGSVSPRKKFAPLPVIPQLLKLSELIGYQQSYCKMKEIIRLGPSRWENFWGGTTCKKILNSIDEFENIVVFGLGMDGVQYDSSHIPKSVFPVGLKNICLHPEDRGSEEYFILFTVIPGSFLFPFFCLLFYLG